VLKQPKYLPKINDVLATIVAFFQTENSLLLVATVVAAESSKSSCRRGTAGRPPRLCLWWLALPVGFWQPPWSTVFSSQSQSKQNKPAITDHVNTENHIIDCEEATVISRESDWTTW